MAVGRDQASEGLRRMRWLRSLFAWREVRDTGAHTYQVNAVTGARRVLRCGAGYQPVDAGWLATGAWTNHALPPSGKSALPGRHV